jgi:hypothetical protein
MKQSKFFSVTKFDGIKAFIVAFIFPIVVNFYEMIQDSISKETFAWPTAVELKHSLFYGIAAGFAYIIKNLFTNSQDQFLVKEKK